MILVTGGTGLVGSHLLYKLTHENKHVVAIYRTKSSIEKAKKIFGYYTQDIQPLFDKIIWKKADLNSIQELEEAFEGITHVYHAAAMISFDPTDFKCLKKINIEGTANIVNLCLANNIKKLCYISSIATLGKPLVDNELIKETTAWNPEEEHSVYAITKYGAELEVWRGSQEGLNVVILNPGIIFGPGFWKSGSGSFFYAVYKKPSHFPEGTSGFVSVNDVSNAALDLMKSSIKNERFILVSENSSFFSVMSRILKIYDPDKKPKVLSETFINLFWRWDWIRSKITKKRRRLTKLGAKSLTTQDHYDNSKIKDLLDFKFEALGPVIAFCAEQFLKERS